MSTIIYHAAKDDTGKYKGGKAGDQTGTEVYARSWYPRPWTTVWEPPTIQIGTITAKAAKDACYNDNIGYDQNQRNTLVTQARKNNWNLSKINVPCETDCSALATVCAIIGGAKESIMIQSGNCATSRTIGARLKKNGWIEHKESKYLENSDYLGAGWILVYEGHHVAINGTAGSKVAGIDITKKVCPYKDPVLTLKKGMRSTGVSWLQWHLNILIEKGYLNDKPLTVDGDWGDKTSYVFLHFQEKYPITGTANLPDGKCGPTSVRKLKSLV